MFSLAACAGNPEADDLAPQPPGPGEALEGGKTDAICPIVPAGIGVTTPPQFSCGPMDAASNLLMSDVARFWASEVGLCACGPDYPDDCSANAVAHEGGWVYTSSAFLQRLRASGSDMPAQYVLAHEFGHEIQGVYGIPGITQVKELQADCYAGYYLGSLICRGLATQQDIVATLTTACVIADGTGDPIGDLDTHGTCEQRVSSVALGMRGYLQRTPALAACRL